MEGIFVNGPINAARLEGTVYGTKKVLYIFMDFHMNVMHQSQCDNIDSIDLNKYILKELKESDKNKTYDLFLEISGTTASQNLTQSFRGRYIDEVMRFFSIESNVESTQRALKNVRYHFIDIRDFLKSNINDIFYNLTNTIKTCVCNEHMTRSDYDFIMSSLYNLDSALHMTYDILFTSNETTSRIKPSKVANSKKRNVERSKMDILTNESKKNYSIVQKFLNKIRSKYEHKDIPQKLDELFEKIRSYFVEIFDSQERIIQLMKQAEIILSKNPTELNKVTTGNTEMYIYGKDLSRIIDFMSKLNILVYEMEMMTVHVYALIVDLFFLRRFLDKDYVQNGIVYAGIAHSMSYIYMLIKYYDFKITNVSYLKEGETIESATKKIKDQTVSNPNIDELFYPPSLYQCSNLSDYPKNFN
ncbi:MAG: hypothetical protein Terrestrivirus4_69 [Terrestrivirus sp.]|uniref:Uncharacterized protein n=1 Tax=Terrestrivirus sp. TaxID=2487775 RepID=A0A3G4ZPW9_9VIRU|nr:MAG: hypothetical protein Terrestrivirus4_69 [Terrestrivirus sp.]